MIKSCPPAWLVVVLGAVALVISGLFQDLDGTPGANRKGLRPRFQNALATSKFSHLAMKRMRIMLDGSDLPLVG
jgi:hypothetical protein